MGVLSIDQTIDQQSGDEMDGHLSHLSRFLEFKKLWIMENLKILFSQVLLEIEHLR